MRVKDEKARDFYDQEAIECGWSKVQLERQIHSACYDRIIANQGEKGLVSTKMKINHEKHERPEKGLDRVKNRIVRELLEATPGKSESTLEIVWDEQKKWMEKAIKQAEQTSGKNTKSWKYR